MEEILTEVVAVSIVRNLAGAPGYPTYEEGEKRTARLLVECCVSVSHARRVVDEFEADFPSLEQIRSTAFRLKEEFVPARADDAPSREELKKIWSNVRDSVPLIPGVRWEVCLQMECIRINLGMRGSPPNHEELAQNQRDFPEAVSAIHAGREPDYKLIENVLAKKIPSWGPIKSIRPPIGAKPITEENSSK